MKAYTAKAKKALDMAARLSRSMHHNYIGTEHILAGLLKEGTGVAAEVLSTNHVQLEKMGIHHGRSRCWNVRLRRQSIFIPMKLEQSIF